MLDVERRTFFTRRLHWKRNTFCETRRLVNIILIDLKFFSDHELINIITFQEKNLNLNRDSNSDLQVQIFSLEIVIM